MDRAWTPERVKAELVDLFRRLPGAPVLAGNKGDLLSAFGDGTVTWDMTAITYRCLGEDRTPRDRERRLMLLTWARVIAMQQGTGGSDTSLRQICNERGWRWQTFLRTVNECAETIAQTMSVTQMVSRQIRTS
jgi:hypothetical protein